MPEILDDSQPSGFTITHTEDLPDFVNLLNRTSDKIAIPSLQMENDKPKNWIEIKPYGTSRLHKTKLKDFRIDTYLQADLIAIEPVHPLFDLRNETARRIEIASKNNQPVLVIPAFGAQRVSKDLLNQYDYTPWQLRNLISVERVESVESNTPWYVNYYFYGWVGLLFIGFFIVVGSSENSEGQQIPPVFIQYTFIAALIWLLIGVLVYIITRQKEGELGRFINLFGLIISAALPVGAVMYFFGDITNLITSDILSIAMLGRFVQFFLILLATLLPGLMYFQFERQRVSSIRDRFFREIMQLNPNVVTREDARISYGGLVDEISGVVGATSRQYALLSFGLPILLSTWMISLGWLIILDPFGNTQITSVEQLYNFLLPAPTALSFAFLGAYFFALNLVFRRYARGDLTPKAYNHITVRIISALVVVWVLTLVPFLKAMAPENLMILAFLVGMFPESGIALLQDLARKEKLGKLFPSLQEKHPITDLEGINLYDRVRLLEEGVESVENLVHYNPIELLLRTRMPLPRLVDLVDQAILYLHVRGEKETSGAHQESLRILRSYGIRTATDLVRLADSFPGEGNGSTEKMVKLEQLMGLLKSENENQPSRLEYIQQAIGDNVWINYLMHWRETSEARDKVYELEDFYQTTDA